MELLYEGIRSGRLKRYTVTGREFHSLDFPIRTNASISKAVRRGAYDCYVGARLISESHSGKAQGYSPFAVPSRDGLMGGSGGLAPLPPWGKLGRAISAGICLWCRLRPLGNCITAHFLPLSTPLPSLTEVFLSRFPVQDLCVHLRVCFPGPQPRSVLWFKHLINAFIFSAVVTQGLKTNQWLRRNHFPLTNWKLKRSVVSFSRKHFAEHEGLCLYGKASG